MRRSTKRPLTLLLKIEMLARLYSVLSVALLLQVLCYGAAEARMMSKAEMRAKQAVAMERFNLQTNSRASGTGVKNITFSNPRASGMSVSSDRSAVSSNAL